jgi:hypothetical protein
MGFESNTGLGVVNHYGARDTEAGGTISGGELAGGEGSEKEAIIYITGDDFAGTTSFDTALTLPAGAIFQSAVFEIGEAFTLGNADNIFSIGTNGSEATNGVAIANPDAAGTTIDSTGGGTWVASAALAADTVVGVAVSGTTAAVTAGAGKAKVVIKYTKV